MNSPEVPADAYTINPIWADLQRSMVDAISTVILWLEWLAEQDDQIERVLNVEDAAEEVSAEVKVNIVLGLNSASCDEGLALELVSVSPLEFVIENDSGMATLIVEM